MKDNIVAGYGCLFSYSHQAYQTFGLEQTAYEDFRSFEAASAALHKGKARWLILPLRNNCQGAIDGVGALLEAYPFKKIDEREVLIEYALFGNDLSLLERIKTVTSHPIALGQCRSYIAGKGWRQIERGDTSGAVLDVMMQNDPTLAAIGPHALGMLNGARLLDYPINDRADNITVFGLFERA